MRAVVLGGSGYAGGELLRLIRAHPTLTLAGASAEGADGATIAARHPGLGAAYPTERFVSHAAAAALAADVYFLALPHGHSAPLAAQLASPGAVVVDLGADFRLRDAAAFAEWYGTPHPAPERLARARYALVERHRSELPGATLLAIPGCYPTAASLALGPFVDAGWVDRVGLVVNGISGASGAGRALRDDLHFADLHGNAYAYGVPGHHHTAEMNQELGASVVFVPHLAPFSRGLLVSAVGRLVPDRPNADVPDPRRTTAGALALLADRYRGEPFVTVTEDLPSVGAVVGSNRVVLSARVDERTGSLVAFGAIDNLGKGAAGQAIQAFNVAVGLPETDGLPTCAVSP